MFRQKKLRLGLCLLLGSATLGLGQDKPFRGGLKEPPAQDKPRPVRNDVAQPGEEIVTLRYFKIKKGTFDQFLKVSIEGVWPY